MRVTIEALLVMLVCGYLFMSLKVYIPFMRRNYSTTLQERDDIIDVRTEPEEGYHLVPVLPDMGNTTLLVYVMCRPDRYERRKLIRDTWGDHSQLHEDGLKQLVVFFALGLSSDQINRSDANKNIRDKKIGNTKTFDKKTGNTKTGDKKIRNTKIGDKKTGNRKVGDKKIDQSTLREAIVNESNLFRDILLLDMQDNYENLTLKGLMTMRWIMKHTSASHILKVDEDVMINPFAWIRLTKELTENNITCCVTGDAITDTQPFRKGKYGISRESYPLDGYPNFVSGPAYMLTRDALAAILEVSDHITGRLRLEDVYFHGILGNQAGVRILAMPSTCFPLVRRKGSSGQHVPMLRIHKASKLRVHDTWRFLQKEFRTGRNGTRLEVRDVSSHENISQILPDKWLLQDNKILHHNCQPGKKENLHVWI